MPKCLLDLNTEKATRQRHLQWDQYHWITISRSQIAPPGGGLFNKHQEVNSNHSCHLPRIFIIPGTQSQFGYHQTQLLLWKPGPTEVKSFSKVIQYEKRSVEVWACLLWCQSVYIAPFCQSGLGMTSVLEQQTWPQDPSGIYALEKRRTEGSWSRLNQSNH